MNFSTYLIPSQLLAGITGMWQFSYRCIWVLSWFFYNPWQKWQVCDVFHIGEFCFFPGSFAIAGRCNRYVMLLVSLYLGSFLLPSQLLAGTSLQSMTSDWFIRIKSYYGEKTATKQCAWQPQEALERAAGDWKDIRRALLAEVKSSAYGDLGMRPTRRMS